MMLRRLTLTIIAKLSGSSENLKKLSTEYTNFQRFLRGDEDAQLYSATKQQGKRTYGKVKQGREYPLVIRKDLVKLKPMNDNKSEVKIPVYDVRGGIKLIALHGPFDFSNVEFLGSKIVKTDNEFFYHISIRTSVDIKESYENALAIDVGSRWLAVVVSTFDTPKFFGKRIREVRGKAFYHRRKQTGAYAKSKEQHIVRDEVNKIVSELVRYAKDNNSIIIVGDLHGVRKKKLKSRKVNRRIHSMPSYMFISQLELAAAKEGIAVLKVAEHSTSRMCSNCGSLDTKRPTQGVFICNTCGYQVNADVNGARNILRRGVGYMLASGAAVGRPEEVGGPFRLPQPGLHSLENADPSCDEQEAAGL